MGFIKKQDAKFDHNMHPSLAIMRHSHIQPKPNNDPTYNSFTFLDVNHYAELQWCRPTQCRHTLGELQNLQKLKTPWKSFNVIYWKHLQHFDSHLVATNTEIKESYMYKKESGLTQLEGTRIHLSSNLQHKEYSLQLSACTKSYMRSQWILQLTVVVRMRREVGRREFWDLSANAVRLRLSDTERPMRIRQSLPTASWSTCHGTKCNRLWK